MLNSTVLCPTIGWGHGASVGRGKVMGVLSKPTIQRLAVLHALSLWQRGAYGPVRLHKTLFFADKETAPEWRLFTFKKWFLGQYSDEISQSLNALAQGGTVTTRYDGPSERIIANLSTPAREDLVDFFCGYFPEWSENLAQAFRQWAYLSNDNIIRKAHEEPSYRNAERGEVIFASFDADQVEFPDLDDQVAERLSDLVDARFQRGLMKRLRRAAERPARGEDWRHIYFGERPRTRKRAS